MEGGFRRFAVCLYDNMGSRYPAGALHAIHIIYGINKVHRIDNAPMRLSSFIVKKNTFITQPTPSQS